jgi:uncharacterized membrane protein
MLEIKSQQNFWAGLFFLCFGAFELFLSLQYELGSTADMGPGFMPALLGCSLMALGFVIAGSGLMVTGPRIERGHWRPFVCIISALLLFAFLINVAGLALTTMLVGLVGGAAYRDRIRWTRLVLMAACLAVFAVVLFINILGQPIPAWWGD